MKTSTVLGLVFDQSLQNVLLHATKAEWAAGRLDGVGGDIGPDESRDAAMVRYFDGAVREALHADTDRRWSRLFATLKWQELACLRDSLRTVWVFCAVVGLDRLSEVGSFGARDGVFQLVSIGDFASAAVPLKLRFLVPLALRRLRGEDGLFIEVVETRRSVE